jgi:hypothetical protein
MNASNHTLAQPTSWDPLDLSDDAVPTLTGTANDGPGIQPDVDTRPELRPVVRPGTEPSQPPPWDE